jgi:drug/metabolite transporter (DMT)-like permease
MGRTVSIILWVGALLGVVVGTLFLVDTILTSQSAPQQGAGAAMAAAVAVLPYVAARAFDAIRRSGEKAASPKK